MTTIDLTVNKDRRKRAVQRARERNIVIPTYAQMKDPSKIPSKVKEELARIGLWDVAPRNLFRITWHNQPKESGGGFSGVNYLELPSSLTGVPARIVVLVGKWFPTGAHKVGAAFGCLVPRLSRVSSTRQRRRRSGPPPATSAAAAPTIRPCWAAAPSPSCRRG